MTVSDRRRAPVANRISGTPVTDWKGNPYAKANGPAAHPNSRFTVSAKHWAGSSDHRLILTGQLVRAFVDIERFLAGVIPQA